MTIPERTTIGDLTYDVVIVSGTATVKGILGKTDEGGIDYENAKIYVRKSSASRMASVYRHERLHAQLDATGAGHLLATLARAAGKDVDETEELFVRMLSPVLT